MKIKIMNARLRQKAIVLRTNQNLSYSEIKNRLGVAKSTLSYWLKEFPLSEKKILKLRKLGWQKGEAGRELFRETMRKRQESKSLAIYKHFKKKFHILLKMKYF